MLLSISEIIKKTVEEQDENEKIKILIENKSLTLLTILRMTYDKSIEFMLPETAPPWKKNEMPTLHSRLYNETRRLKIFVKGRSL